MKQKRKPTTVMPFVPTGTFPYDAESDKAGNIVGRRIAEARKRTGMSLTSFSQCLKKFGLTVGRGGLGKWETGETVPNAYQLIAICAAAGLDGDLHYFTSDYRPELNEIGLRKVEDYKADLIASGKYNPEPQVQSIIPYLEMRVSDLRVSAGTGNFLDEDSFEIIPFPASSVPAGADFGIRVAGDSMEPRFHDEQIVWVKQCDRVNVGDIGIFVYDGEGYIKLYEERRPSEEDLDEYKDSDGILHPQRVLISLNPAYNPIVVSPFSSFEIVGKVLEQ